MAQIPGWANRRSQLSKQTGDAWEMQARSWLERQGLRFIAANVCERGGEIDLIMRDGSVTVFVEVRYRRSEATAMPLPASRRKSNKDCSKPRVCGSADRMGALRLWIAVSMW